MTAYLLTDEVCERCAGAGDRPAPIPAIYWKPPVFTRCPDCAGTGRRLVTLRQALDAEVERAEASNESQPHSDRVPELERKLWQALMVCQAAEAWDIFPSKTNAQRLSGALKKWNANRRPDEVA